MFPLDGKIKELYCKEYKYKRGGKLRGIDVINLSQSATNIEFT